MTQSQSFIQFKLSLESHDPCTTGKRDQDILKTITRREENQNIFQSSELNILPSTRLFIPQMSLNVQLTTSALTLIWSSPDWYSFFSIGTASLRIPVHFSFFDAELTIASTATL